MVINFRDTYCCFLQHDDRIKKYIDLLLLLHSIEIYSVLNIYEGDNKWWEFLAYGADNSSEDGVIVQFRYGNESMALEKRRSMSKRPLVVMLFNCYRKKPGYITVTGASKVFLTGKNFCLGYINI